MDNRDNENTENKKSNTVILDGKQVSQQELSEAQENPSVRIIENGANNYKTLHRMQG
jgi:hypothetical protein